MPKDTSQHALRGAGTAEQDALWSGIAHDLRQPLQALLFLTHVIAGEASAERRAQIGREMETALLAFQEMLDQIGQLTRLEAGEIAPQPQPCSLHQLLEHTYRKASDMVGEDAVELRIEPTVYVAVIDQQLLEAVVSAAVLNAMRLRASGIVSVACVSRRGQYRIDLAFLAPHIPAREKTSMFVQWPRKLEGVDTPLTIAGLGLVQRLASQIGVSINYTSDRGGKQHLILSWPVNR